MRGFILTLLGLTASLFKAHAAPNKAQVIINIDGETHQFDEVITRDVTVIGGGSAGTYSAIRLHDMNKTVVVVEATGRLGGHTETYTDPNTGVAIDYGVVVYHPFDLVKDYFARLRVAGNVTTNFGGTTGVTTLPMDFLTGRLSLVNSPDLAGALQAWAGLLQQYPYLDYGYELPNPVPDDLLMLFGNFISKYNLQALATFAYFFTQGIGDMLNQPAMYVMKSFDINSVIALQQGFWTTTARDNSLLYLAAEQILGSDVLYNSRILKVHRSDSGTQVILKTCGKTVLIKSRKLIIAIQPTLDNLQHFDLTHQERQLFEQWKWSQYVTGLVSNTGLPSNTTLTNIRPAESFGVPPPPSLYSLSQTSVPGVIDVKYIDTNSNTSDCRIKQTILDDIKRAQVPGKSISDPEFLAYSNHKPFNLWVEAPAIKNGFYSDLYSLQGKRNSWYISATMHTHDSSLIWRYAESLLPAIAA